MSTAHCCMCCSCYVSNRFLAGETDECEYRDLKSTEFLYLQFPGLRTAAMKGGPWGSTVMSCNAFFQFPLPEGGSRRVTSHFVI